MDGLASWRARNRSYDENDFWHEYDQEQAPSLHRGMEGWHGLNDSISL
jgi:hypothetical protein